jgi:hypothetical protein
LPDEVLTRADEVVQFTASRIAEATRTGVWSGYSDGVIALDLPPWAFSDSQEATDEN